MAERQGSVVMGGQGLIKADIWARLGGVLAVKWRLLLFHSPLPPMRRKKIIALIFQQYFSLLN